MKGSQILHFISAVTGVIGALALIAAWSAGQNGLFLGMNEQHLFSDVQALMLISISSGIGTLVHLKQEGK